MYFILYRSTQKYQKNEENDKRRRHRVPWVFLTHCCFCVMLIAFLVALILALTLNSALANNLNTSLPLLAVNNASIILFTETLELGPDEMLTRGDSIKYNLIVQNTGNTAIQNVQVFSNVSSVVFTCGEINEFNFNITLLPGENITCMARKQIIIEDIVAGGIFSVQSTLNASPNITDVAAVSTNITVDTMAELYVFSSGTPNDGGDGLFDEGDTITWSTKIFNTGTATLVNVTLGSSIVIAKLLPMGMEIIEQVYVLTTQDISEMMVHFEANVTAVSVSTLELLSYSTNATVDLSQPVEGRLSISDVIYKMPATTQHPHTLLSFVDQYGTNIPLSCPNVFSFYAHDITVTNTGTDIVDNVTVDTWMTDARVFFSETPFQMTPLDKLWYVNCPPMFNSSVIGTMLPGESQTCQVLYSGLVWPTEFGTINIFQYYTSFIYPVKLGLNTTRVTNATVTGTSATSGTALIESTPSSQVNLGGNDVLALQLQTSDTPVPVRAVDGNRFALSTYNLSYTNLDSNSFANGLATGYFTFFDYALGVSEGSCSSFSSEYSLTARRIPNLSVPPRYMTFKEFNVSSKHIESSLYLSFDHFFSATPSFSGTGSYPRFEVKIDTVPASLRESWTFSVVKQGTQPITWDSATGILTHPAEVARSTGGLVIFSIGDLNAYESIRIGVETVFPFTLPAGTDHLTYIFRAIIYEKITLPSILIDKRDLEQSDIFNSDEVNYFGNVVGSFTVNP